ncbi:Uma2 family endonuclease [Cohnella herbarum]|uniref:Uma2 family endonuclease n=1 Tax=Cohnella herbarum TaxID=2728023 RepID=A0A7Z2VPW7_9BACL|nr:Uma2 family endonuclease [Cohnella herbarum]QJD86939.1 Uma2 family endonuclease [Cohnella herbarum]
MSDKANKKDQVKEQTEEYQSDPASSSHLPPYSEIPLIEERYEIIDGIRYDCHPSPTLKHQLLVTHLCNDLQTSCHATGTIVVAPMDVHLDEDNIVQPDLIYVSNENESILKTRIEGVPDLLVEILSPSTGEHDKVRKKALYERFGVREYWIVDSHHRTIDQFALQAGKYVLEKTYGSADVLFSERFPCVNVRLGKLFEILNRFVDSD